MRRLTGLLILCVCIVATGPVLSQEVQPSDLPPGVTILNVKWESFVTLGTVSSGSLGNAPSSNPNRLPLPTQGTSETLVRTQLYAYSVQLSNEGPKPIKAVAWDFIFLDAARNTELQRHSLANAQKIDVRHKKTLRFNTQLSPPRVVSAAALEKNRSSPFKQTVTIRCVFYADDSTWEQPAVTDKPCESLRAWLERRKKWHSTVEDPPFVP